MNENIYKSGRSLVFWNFIRLIIVPFALFAAHSLASDAQDIMTILYVLFVLAIALSVYFAFYRNNIEIEVTNEAIKFSRHGREYLNIDRKTHDFSSYTITNQYGAVISRCLRVIPKYEGKYKDYKCYNFDKKTFELFIAKASLNLEKQIKTEYNGASLTFTINKFFMLRKYEKYKFISIVAIHAFILCVIAIPLFNISPIVYPTILLFLFFSSVISIIKTVNFSKVKKQTPEKITISKDKLTIDNEDFYFSYLTLIKMTSPYYEQNAHNYDPFKSFRKMTITERNISHEFFPDIIPKFFKKNSNPKSAFPEYEILFNELRELLAYENKFIAELE